MHSQMHFQARSRRKSKTEAKKTNVTSLNSLYNILSAFSNSIYRFLPNKLREKRKQRKNADQSGHFNPTE